MIGPACSGVGLEILKEVAIKNNVPMISYANTSPQFTVEPNNGLYARTVPSDKLQGTLQGKLALKTSLNAITIYRDDYGSNLNDAFIEEFEKGGGTILKKIAYPITESYFEDIKSKLDEIKNISEEFIIVGVLFPETIKILEYLKQDINTQSKAYFFNDGIFNDDVDKNTYPENTYITVPGGSSEILQNYYSVISGDNWGFPFAASLYDAVALALLSLTMNGSGADLLTNIGQITQPNSSNEIIRATEIRKGLDLLKNKKDLTYKGYNFSSLEKTLGNGYEPGGTNDNLKDLYKLFTIINNQFSEQVIEL